MNKVMSIVVGIAISAFLMGNLYLLFSDKSVITKSVYVDSYERMTSSDYHKKITKEGLVAPVETYSIYVGNEDAVDSWLVKEGDLVNIGDEIAILQTERAEGQYAVWEAELEALREQRVSVQNVISNLDSQWKEAKSTSTTHVNRKENADDTKEEVGWEIDVQVDVNPDGSYAQAITTAEQELATIDRQLVVVETQLAQNPSRPALISPVEGVVSKVTRHGSKLGVDIFSSQKVIVTYAKNNEWLQVASGDRVLIQGAGVEKATEGTVLTVSEAPAVANEWLSTYKALDDTKAKNPLAYYEVRIVTDSGLKSAPFGTNVKAVVIVNEALDAISVEEKGLYDFDEGTAKMWMIDNTGRAAKVAIVTPFALKNRAVVTEGLQIGDVVLYEPALHMYGDTPKVFLTFPTDLPKMAEWKAFGWRNYIKYMLVK